MDLDSRDKGRDMGLYDHIDMMGGVIACPHCNKPIDAVWQTNHCAQALDTIPWWDVMQYHATCSNKGCGRFVVAFANGITHDMDMGEDMGRLSDICADPMTAQEMRAFALGDEEFQQERHYENAKPVTWTTLPLSPS